MIIDSFDRIAYLPGIPRQREIAAWLAVADWKALPHGDHPIDGVPMTDLFVRVRRYQPSDPAKGLFEMHRHFTDIQVIVSGTDRIDTVPASDVEPSAEYSEKGDVSKHTARTNRVSVLVLPAGTFALFSPGEPHKPGVAFAPNAEVVHKVTFKVRTA